MARSQGSRFGQASFENVFQIDECEIHASQIYVQKRILIMDEISDWDSHFPNFFGILAQHFSWIETEIQWLQIAEILECRQHRSNIRSCKTRGREVEDLQAAQIFDDFYQWRYAFSIQFDLRNL